MPKVIIDGSFGNHAVLTGDAAKEFIRRIDNPTEEELEATRKMLDRCRELAKDIPMRRTSDVRRDN